MFKIRDRFPAVYGLGQCSLDYIGKIKNYPPADSKCEFSGLVIQGGGPVATALAALSRWGIHCTFAGVIGDDPFGEQIRAGLEAEGIDLRGLLVRKGLESQFAFIAAEPGLGRRTIFWQRPTGPPPGPEELDFDLIRRAKVFHTDGLFPEASLAAAKAAREAGVPVVVDAGSLREGMLDLARLSDYFIASSAFARSLVGKDDPVAACRQMAALGPGLGRGHFGERGICGPGSGPADPPSGLPGGSGGYHGLRRRVPCRIYLWTAERLDNGPEPGLGGLGRFPGQPEARRPGRDTAAPRLGKIRGGDEFDKRRLVY